MPRKFIVNDESVLNDRGFRVLNAGGRLEQFKKNPLGLFMHIRPDRWNFNKDSVLPICKWTNPEIEGTTMTSTPTFDQDDDFAKKIEGKVEGGYLNMASMGLIPITTSSDERYLLPGQTRETVVEWELVELSIADLGSNPNSIGLYTRDEEGNIVALSAETEGKLIPLISSEKTTETEQIQETKKMDKIAILVGLAAGATEDQICAEVNKLIGQKTDLTNQVETIRLSSITGVVDQAITDKRITADKKDHFIGLGKAVGVESLRTTIELMKPTGKPTDELNLNSGKKSDTPEIVTLASLMEEGSDAIRKFREEKPAEYATLYKAHYGRDYIPGK